MRNWIYTGKMLGGTMPNVIAPTPAPGIIAPSQSTNTPGGSGVVPFRRASKKRFQQSILDTYTPGASTQPVNRVIEGTGYVGGIDLRLHATSAGNALNTAFAEDGPWSALSSVVWKDVGPEVINLQGYDLFLVNKYFGTAFKESDTSADTSVFNKVTGSGATGGSFNFWLRVPIATNDRALLGLMGNQDRAIKYELRTDVAPSSSIWTTAPTTIPTMTIERYYDYWPVPAPKDDTGKAQQQVPPGYGVVHYLTKNLSESNPAANSTVNHWLKRLGNTIRFMILIFRDAGTSRATAETNLPGTMIDFKIGDDVLYSESFEHRRKVMFERYGFDAPSGVLVYDFMHDFAQKAGYELGDDYLDTRNVVNAQLRVTYGAGWSANSTLQIITDDLYVPDNMDLFSVIG